MDWGEWRATAMTEAPGFHRITLPDGGGGWSINGADLPIDGPYCATRDEALAALHRQLKEQPS